MVTMKEVTYTDRTDSFEEKMRLLNEAWRKGDYRLARALTNSLRNTAIQAQHEKESLGQPVAAPGALQPVAALPAPWREWAKGWSHCLSIATDETVGSSRPPEPIEFVLNVPAAVCHSLQREVRVARVENGALREVPSQVHLEVRRGAERHARLLLLAGSAAHTRTHYIVFVGNPEAELPEYPSDLETRGEGFALDIENDFFRASLSRQMGQLERLTFKREHGLELFAGGEGHGEPPGIDWAHDYVGSGNFQKLRVTLWDTCPDYEVVRGPLCTSIRRWGFPYSPVHPVFSPSRIHVDVEYRFYAGLPWFHKIGRMEAIKSLEADALRDDEWVFSGQSFTEQVWMGPDGKLRTGPVDPALRDNMWAVGFINPKAEDAFIALFLDHRAENLPSIRHGGSPLMFYKWHGHCWSRYPLPGKEVPAGAVLHQKNAYLALHYTAKGAELVETMRHRLVNPLVVSAATLPSNLSPVQPAGRLARPGEAGDSPISKADIWNALRDCKDEQLYAAKTNVVDLGLIYDVRVRGDAVHLIMAMPHRGRPRIGFFTYGSGGNNTAIRQRLMRVPGVRRVVVEQTWEPHWSSNRLTDDGRRSLGLA
jgi:metal-sulfur cluster biosynthetic enzyme